MAKRINRAVELLEGNQPIYYTGGHTGAVLTYEQGKKDAHTWADYINVGMEHGAFDMTGLAEYMRGLCDGGPTKSGHRTPPVIVELPADGTSEPVIRYNSWQVRQILVWVCTEFCCAWPRARTPSERSSSLAVTRSTRPG